VNIKLQEAPTILTLENYKANFCIFFNDLDILETYSRNDSFENKDLFKKLLNTVYVALKGDINSSPNFDTIVNISMMDNYIVLCISGNDPSKFRSSIVSLFRLVDLICQTLYLVS